MSQLPVHPSTAVRVARDPLVTVTCIFIILGVLGVGFSTVRENLAALAAATANAAQAGRVEESSYTNAEAAHVTLTNLNPYPTEACFRAVVSKSGGGSPVASVPVCTGVMKPRTTTILVAPYSVGAIEKLCSGEPDRFGNTRLDWSRCSFTTEAVK